MKRIIRSGYAGIIIMTLLLIAVSFAINNNVVFAQQQNLTKIIEGKFVETVPGIGPTPTVTVEYESPMTIILDASQFNTKSLWQAMDIVKGNGYTMDQVMPYVSSVTESGTIYHWLVFMSKR